MTRIITNTDCTTTPPIPPTIGPIWLVWGSGGEVLLSQEYVTLVDFYYHVPFGFLVPNKFQISWLSNILALSVPEEGYRRHTSSGLNLLLKWVLHSKDDPPQIELCPARIQSIRTLVRRNWLIAIALLWNVAILYIIHDYVYSASLQMKW
jgi:hypothetical protein